MRGTLVFRRLARAAPLLLLCLLTQGPAAAATTPPLRVLSVDTPAPPSELPPPEPPAVPQPPHTLEPDLYLEAMQAISEGRKSDASSTLARMIAHGPRNAGEWLDLAMLQCALGHADEAEELFKAIEARFDPPKGLRDIIEQQRAQGCSAWKRLQQWSLVAARGYDQNVNQGASNPLYQIGGAGEPLQLAPEYLPHADRYAVLSADYLVDLNQNGDLGFVQMYARHNDHESNYNTFSMFAGADHPWRWQRWRLRASGLLGALTLGGHLYQSQTQVQLRVTPPLPLPEQFELSLMTGLTHLNYRTLSNFDSNTSELRGTLGYRTEQRQAQLTLGYLNDHAVAARPGGNRTGYTASLYGRTLLGAKLEAEVDWTAQHWEGQSAYSPGLIDTVRRQDTRTLRASLSYPLTPNTALVFEWRQINNKENISIFQYDNHVFQLSWRWRDGR
jgi:hypothetical protein